MRREPVSEALLSTFGGQIKHRRQEARLSYQDLADLAHIAKSSLFDIERNAVAPSVYVAARIAKALGTTVDDLLSHQPVSQSGARE